MRLMSQPALDAPVIAFVPDLFFAAKIAATAEAAGVRFEALDAAAALARCSPSAGLPTAAPRLLLLDLGAGEPALALARELRARLAASELPIVGFYSHVDTATRDAALAAGVETVMPRSAFVARLPELLRGA
jgi:DNA-binding NarL/FixJ family response regulator